VQNTAILEYKNTKTGTLARIFLFLARIINTSLKERTSFGEEIILET
jgi:hypothetical protein